MSFPCSKSPVWRVSFLGAAVFLAASLASAQSAQNQDDSTSFSPLTESSSQQMVASLDPGIAAPASLASSSAAPAAAQDNTTNYSGWKGHDIAHRLTFEAGGGFNGPLGNDTPFITWGGNFTVGAGVRFSSRVSALLEYQFIDNKLPGNFIAAEGVTAGDAHINSITGSPLIDLTPKRANGVYLMGGFGYYHKSTNFNDYECCAYSYFGYYDVEVTVASVTSNQWGANGGVGLYHRLGGMYGDSKTQLFAEARYTYIHTPSYTQQNGFGTTELIPVTLGVRF